MNEKQTIYNQDFHREGLVVGIDDMSPAKGQDVVAKTLLYFVILVSVGKWLANTETPTEGNQSTTSSSSHPRIEGTDLALGEIRQGASHECAVCLDLMPVGAAVRILPCRHAFHHACIVGWFDQDKHTCPLCKFDLRQHLEEQRAAYDDDSSAQHDARRGWLFRAGRMWRRIETNEDNLLDAEEDGDLELTEELSVSPEAQVVIV